MKVIISGGGTGGHIFPAISIAGVLKEMESGVAILFVGAEGRMEMEKVPAAGYDIVGLPVAGLQRRLTFKNLTLPVKLIKSINRAAKIIRDFKPDAVVGVGGYASAPVLWQAQRMGIPTLIQEQNSYAGLTNRLLSKRAECVCVAYPDMERFFPKEKMFCTGNPVRQDLYGLDKVKDEAANFFGINVEKPTVLALGGSLGARTVNESIAGSLDEFEKNNVGLVWQTGKHYFDTAVRLAANRPFVKVFDFIYKMNYAFSAADIIVSRAGAGTISELCIAGKPAILIPSPNVSEDHQTKNAMSLVERNAAIMIRDGEAREKLVATVIELISNRPRIDELKSNISTLAMPGAAKEIVNRLLMIVKQYKVN
ncbi:MAG: undecaprenyldiphospho-muramoylpentapeptide beta-N-acetylglucosaminyltransferase [Prevotellaceae bacterium]|jgi:UDP-N-acetylglucosamine--N-acetylmuramyl-(pentapeptide) pyrophosphoryl-undecaprenol N-acetylglucosamine transferase|nr:undecaprenyldiphospho-muramoylpentapeptide beta-N-acetylglucosaminyltransferase [Prevotellaceae bacterium]